VPQFVSVIARANDLIRPDRRRYPRLHLVGQFDGRIVPFQIGVRVLDISAGGFAVKSTFDFPAGSEHEFQLATVHRPRPVIRAVVAHSRRVTSSRGYAYFVAGFTFVGLSADARATIDAVVAQQI
jgi:hypothetical protein